jgi:hypothetical protein
MKNHKRFLKNNKTRKKNNLTPRWLAAFFLLTVLLNGCRGEQDTPTPSFYLPPTQASSPAPPSPDQPASLPSPTPACANGLLFLEDVTIPDGSVVSPRDVVVKRWRVKNAGTCNWERGYTVQLVSAQAYGAPSTQPLYPARPDREVILEIIFTAPEQPGRYKSHWQAYSPEGDPFGDPFFVDFVVQADQAEGE